MMDPNGTEGPDAQFIVAADLVGAWIREKL